MRHQLAGVVATLLMTLAPRMSAQIFVNQTAQYRYIDATGAFISVPGNWYSVGFDDSAWLLGNGVFANRTPSATIVDQANVNDPFAPAATDPVPSTFTQWDVNHDPYLRTYFNLIAPQDLTIWIAVDNGIGTTAGPAGLYFNGIQTSNVINAEGRAFRWEIAFDVPAALTVAGQNLIALQLEDHGGDTGFDMMVTAKTGSHPIFTTATPEPSTIVLAASGFALLVAARRKRSRAL